MKLKNSLSSERCRRKKNLHRLERKELYCCVITFRTLATFSPSRAEIIMRFWTSTRSCSTSPEEGRRRGRLVVLGVVLKTKARSECGRTEPRGIINSSASDRHCVIKSFTLLLVYSHGGNVVAARYYYCEHRHCVFRLILLSWRCTGGGKCGYIIQWYHPIFILNDFQ